MVVKRRGELRVGDEHSRVVGIQIIEVREMFEVPEELVWII